MARGRCQAVAEAFVRPLKEADRPHPTAHDPFRVRKRCDPSGAVLHYRAPIRRRISADRALS